VIERHVATKAAADRSHRGIEEVVVGAISRAAVAHLGIELRGWIGALEQRILRIVQILLAEVLANLAETHHGEQPRHLVPVLLLEQASDAIEQSVSHGGATTRLLLLLCGGKSEPSYRARP
jgi:hypothetical protein